jgi:hypothetical protein
MNIDLIVRYLCFLLQARGLERAFVRVTAREIGGRQRARRANLHLKH